MNLIIIKINEYLTQTLKLGYSLHSYSVMYSVCLQSVIDAMESQQNPFSTVLWRIKAGYSKIINSFVMKIKELDYEAEMAVSSQSL